MELLDLGAPTPQKFKPSHLSRPKMTGKSVNSLSSSTSSLKSLTKGKETSPKILQQAESTKSEIVQAVSLILEGKRLKHSYEWYYSSVESLCRFKSMEHSQISNLILEQLKEYYNEHVNPKIKSILLSEGELTGKGPRTPLHRLVEISRSYLEVYDDWENKLRTMTKVFLYLDRGYLKQHPVKMMIMEYGTRILIDNLTRKTPEVGDEEMATDDVFYIVTPATTAAATETSMSMALINLASSLLHETRSGKFQEETTTNAASAILSNLVKLNFKNEFPLSRIWIDKALVEHSVILKQVQRSFVANPEQLPTYFHIYNNYLRAEIQFMLRCGEHRVTQRQFRSKMKWCWMFKLLGSTLKLILPTAKVNPSRFPQDSVTKLEDIYKFCVEADGEYGIDALTVFFYEWNQNVCREVEDALKKATAVTTTNATSTTPCVDAVISMTQMYDTEIDRDLLSEDLYSKIQFETRNAFLNVFSNAPTLNTKVTTQLCGYCDTFFKQRKRLPAHQKVFKTTVLKVFNFLSNKSNFLIQYKRDLSRRLLFNKSLYLDLERDLIAEFCLVVGEDNNQDLMLMFEDLVKEHNATPDEEASEVFNPIILKKEYWPDFPSYTRLQIRLPAELQSLIEGFSKLYIAKDERHNRKVLDWGYFNYHQVTILAQFAGGSKDLTVNLLQASIILLFNSHNELFAQQVADLLEIELENSQIGLHSLSTAKYPILTTNEAGAYLLNEEFSEKSTKLKIPFKGHIVHPNSLKRAHQQPEDDPFDALISKNRTSELRALMVRIMKLDRKLSYTVFLKTTIDALEKKSGDGPILVSELKSNIEFLIDNGYISRSGDDLTYIP